LGVLCSGRIERIHCQPVLLGVFGGNFAMYNLWLPEQYPTAIRASAFAFVTSVGRFIGAGVNF